MPQPSRRRTAAITAAPYCASSREVELRKTLRICSMPSGNNSEFQFYPVGRVRRAMGSKKTVAGLGQTTVRACATDGNRDHSLSRPQALACGSVWSRLGPKAVARGGTCVNRTAPERVRLRLRDGQRFAQQPRSFAILTAGSRVCEKTLGQSTAPPVSH